MASSTKYLVVWNEFCMNTSETIRYFVGTSKLDVDQFLKRQWRVLCAMQDQDDVPWTYWDFETGTQLPIPIRHGKLIYLPKIRRDWGPKLWMSANFIIVESNTNEWIRDLDDESDDEC